MFGKQKLATLVAEFLGTGALTLLVLSTQRSSIGSIPLFVALVAGLTVAVMMFVLRGASAGYFNPALTLGMWTARKVSTITAVLYMVMEFLGAWAAYGLYRYFINVSVPAIGGHYAGRILIAEAVGTAIFTFGFAAAVYHRHTAAVAASYAGLAYAIAIIAVTSASLGLLNPALALGDRAFVWGTYVAGPAIGAIVGVNLYDLLFAPEGESSSVLNGVKLTQVSSPEAAKKKSSRRAVKKA